MIKLLEGVRVVECAVLFNGDQTGRLLGDLGADVIKVEAPGVGDYLRDFLGQLSPHNSPAHVFANRNKRSITLDLHTEEGRDAFFALLRTADIFVDGFAGDACDRLGIGYEAQRAVKPDIIYAQCSGFGASGPYAQIPTHGQMMGALGGGSPLAMGDDGLAHEQVGGLADGTMVGASHTVMTALAALHHRDRTGEGARIDGAGSDAVLATQWFHATYRWNDSRLTDRRGLVGGEGPSAKYHFYETSDERFILFCAIENKFWRHFCEVVDRPDLADVEQIGPVDFAKGDTDLAHELQAIFHTRTQREWTELALAHDIALGPAHRLDDLRDDPHLQGREIIIEHLHPHAGPVTLVGWAAPVQGQPFEITRPAPMLGEHTVEVLREIGQLRDDPGTVDRSSSHG
ncbi:MAG: fldA 8 [Ilumatobacteraceae bacterium]|nr:fldA 8 [Ilumatobacteraceae bacterium]MCU1389912.1 fldA 8 [Ilumatobacteraceae bacterium]